MFKTKKIISIIAILSLVLSTSVVNQAKADSIVNAKDRLSSSAKGGTSTHYVTFTTKKDLAVGEYFEVVFPTGQFTNLQVGNISCPAGMTNMRPNADTARCQSDAGTASGTQSITITGVTNPNSIGSQLININSKTVGGTLKENIGILVAIVDQVTVNVNVPSSLTFEVYALATTTSINGITTTHSSATSSMNFGSLQVGTSSIVGQELRVTTNANYGYTVTVEQNQNLLSQSGADIDSFVDGTSSVVAAAWQAPAGQLDVEWTYGHMGVTTDDATLAVNQFTNDTWKGFNGTTTMPVMYHTGPSDGSTQNKGKAKVAYRIQISALQEAGDYTNTLTYVATPTY